MPNDTAIDLNLIETGALIDELLDRHEEIIIIRENRKDEDLLNLNVKTKYGRLVNKDTGFDLILAIKMLHTCELQLCEDYLEAPQDADEAP